MEAVAFAKDRFKSFSRSTDRFMKGVLQKCHKRSSQSPIEILKRLQREAFSDLMRLRERQEKVERSLSFHQSAKGNPFQESQTHMKGIVNADGALIFLGNDYQQASDNLDLAGTRRGIDLKFIFETPIRQRDLLVAEFLASHHSLVNHSNMIGIPLALSKLVYMTCISNWLSTVFVPFGAQCIEFGVPSFHQGYSFGQKRFGSRSSSFCPQLFNQPQSCGIGFIIEESNLAASLAGLVSEPGADASFVGNLGLSTFFQVSYKPFEEARVTMSCIWKTARPSKHLNLGPIALPRRSTRRQTIADSCVEECSPSAPTKVADCIAEASVALMLESQFDESTNLDCWVEMWKSSPGLLKWGVSLSDAPPEVLGWGLKVGGQFEGHFNQAWLEGFLNFSLGKKAVIQPGILYAVNGESRTPAILLRSSWFMMEGEWAVA